MALINETSLKLPGSYLIFRDCSNPLTLLKTKKESETLTLSVNELVMLPNLFLKHVLKQCICDS